MTAIERIQEWYAQQCDGIWEHRFGIKIDSCDNPGWWVKIDLAGTDLECAQFTPVRQGVDENDFPVETEWLDCRVEANVFNGAGNANKLEMILTIFLDWKDRCEQRRGT